MNQAAHTANSNIPQRIVLIRNRNRDGRLMPAILLSTRFPARAGMMRGMTLERAILSEMFGHALKSAELANQFEVAEEVSDEEARPFLDAFLASVGELALGYEAFMSLTRPEASS